MTGPSNRPQPVAPSFDFEHFLAEVINNPEHTTAISGRSPTETFMRTSTIED